MTTLNIVAFIVIPSVIFLLTLTFGAIKFIIRFAQYLAHTEEALDKVADSNVEIRDEVRGYKQATDERFEAVNERVHGLDRRVFSIENRLERTLDDR